MDEYKITNSIIVNLIPQKPDVIDYGSEHDIEEDIIKLAFDNGYKINRKSKRKFIEYALKNHIEIPDDIWDLDNIKVFI